MLLRNKAFRLTVTVFLTLCLVLGIAVSCSGDETDNASYATADITLKVSTPAAETKDLSVITDNNVASDGAASYYWGYTAVKTDSYGKAGQTDGITALNGGEPGIANLRGLSVGKWKITLFAYVDGSLADSKIVYQSTPTNVTLRANSANSIAIAVNRVQKAGADGTLVIKPSELTVAPDASSVWVIPDGQELGKEDPNALGTPFGTLSEYAYKIEVFTDSTYSEEGKQTVIDTTYDSAYADETDIETALSAGRHYVKIEIYRTGANAGDAKPEIYLAMFPVQIYSNCATTIRNNPDAGGKGGLEIKKVKEFKVNYRSFAPGEDASDATSDTSLEFFASGANHQNFLTDELDEHGQPISGSYPTLHQYGKSEQLDEPVLQGSGFDGYYHRDANGNWNRVRYVPAWSYQDITLYAKWAPRRYASIAYDDNFPAKAKERGETSAHSGSFDTSTADENGVPTMPGDPSAVGYKFMGWKVDDDHSGYKNDGVHGLPAAWNANMKVVLQAQWEPIEYTIAYAAPPSNPSDTSDTLWQIAPENWDELDYVFSKMDGRLGKVKYDENASVIDAENIGFGFLGWTTDSNVAMSTNNYDKSKVIGIDGSLPANMTDVDGGTVTLYPVWSDYFSVIEYIRSYAKSSNKPHIDTLCTSNDAERITLKAELAGQPLGNVEYLSGAGSTSAKTLNHALISLVDGGKRQGYWGFLGPSLAISGSSADYAGKGLYFEDEIHEVEMYAGNDGFYLKDGKEGEDPETIMSFDSSLPSSGYTVYLFAANIDGSAAYHTDMRLYGCNMYNSAGKMIRRFVPVKLRKTVIAERSSTGAEINVTANTQYALWDMFENRFYPNMGTGRFYGPEDEVTITFHRNTTLTDTETRTQKVLKSSILPEGERLHVNLFSRQNSQFTGWMRASAMGSGTGPSMHSFSTRTTRYGRKGIQRRDSGKSCRG